MQLYVISLSLSSAEEDKTRVCLYEFISCLFLWFSGDLKQISMIALKVEKDAQGCEKYYSSLCCIYVVLF